MPFLIRLIVAGSLAAGLVACRNDMAEQPRADTYAPFAFFPDDAVMRYPIPGTIKKGEIFDERFAFGREGGGFTASIPARVDMAFLERGRERYDVYCAPCHDEDGTGRGMIVRRGFPAPPSFHEERLLMSSVGYLFSIATNGFRLMPAYGAQVPTLDRWAIIAHIKVLQLRRRVPKTLLTEDEQEKVRGGVHGD